MKEYGDVRFHKFASNNKEVMETFDSNDLTKILVNLNFEKDALTQGSLGLLWEIPLDSRFLQKANHLQEEEYIPL